MQVNIFSNKGKRCQQYIHCFAKPFSNTQILLFLILKVIKADWFKPCFMVEDSWKTNIHSMK